MPRTVDDTFLVSLYRELADRYDFNDEAQRKNFMSMMVDQVAMVADADSRDWLANLIVQIVCERYESPEMKITRKAITAAAEKRGLLWPP